MIHSVYYEMYYTVAKHCKDDINNPPTFRPKDLLPLSNRNSITFWIYKGIMYHWTSYLTR